MSKQVSEPRVDRPVMPDGYGVPESDETILPWSFAVERLEASRNFWICTANAAGMPAATPVWGVWMDGKLYFDGAPTTRRGRNIQENPNVVVHLESGDEVVILEGQAVVLSGPPEPGIGERLAQGYTAKYAQFGYSPKATDWDNGGLFIFTPEKAIGWAKFPDSVTRWRF